MSAEEWRPVPDYPGYEVSSSGRVASLIQGVRRELRGGLTGAGYRKVFLRATDGSRRGQKVHHLVAFAFLGRRPPGADAVRHLDDDKSNNAAANLAYGNKSDNALDAVRNGLHANARKTHCPRGHAYDERNTYVSRTGRRSCRACARDRHLGTAA